MFSLSVRCIITVFLFNMAPGILAAQGPEARRLTESYLYVGDDEVRHEILMPVSALESLLPVQIDADPTTLSAAEQAASEKTVLMLLDSLNDVMIDEAAVTLAGGSVTYFEQDVVDVVAETSRRDIASANALAGVILRYETNTAPRRVSMRWGAFNEIIPAVSGTVYFEDQENRLRLSSSQPMLLWNRVGEPRIPVPLPVPSPEKTGWFGSAPSLTGEQAKTIFTPLLGNLYRAFDYRRESDIYDALAESVSGGMLAQIYLDVRRGLELEAAGGPVVRVLDVQLSSGKIAEGDGRRFLYDAEWIVEGSVEHWGHVHRRKNLYRAQFEVSAADDAWRISGLQLHGQERLETVVLRRGESEPTAP